MRRFIIWVATLLVVGAFVGSLGALAILYYFGQGLPDYAQLAKYEPPVSTRLYASDGRLFAEYATQKRIFVPIEAIPERVKKTFLAAEDKSFYAHTGLDFFGIIRAAFVNLMQMGSNKRLVGASTVTQQVAKNLLLANMSTRASFDRKIKEAILAFRIESALSKDRILEIYLNEIYLGRSSYGVAAAALNYFDKALNDLSIAEMAYLAALPKAPSKYNPKRHYEEAKARRDWVISRMYEENLITWDEAKAAQKEPITFKKPDPKKVVRADCFAEEVRRIVASKYGESGLYQGGLTVRTTLTPQLQKTAEWALRKGLMGYDRRHGWRGALYHVDLKSTEESVWLPILKAIEPPPGSGRWQLAIVLELTPAAAQIGLRSGMTGKIPLKELKWARQALPPIKNPSGNVPILNVGPQITHPQEVVQVGDIILVDVADRKNNAYSLQQIPEVSGALIVMDPHTGRVLAMAGGFSFDSSQFNRVSQAKRQPGSAIKPFVYLTAMERGFSPTTCVSDSPISVAMGYGLGTYAPKNVTSRYYGTVPLRVGLQKSLNMMTIRLVHQYIGMRPVARLIEKFGIMDRVPMQLAMALGAGETTLLRLATGYSMLANGGKKLTPTLIDRVQDRHGNTIFVSDTRSCAGCNNISWRGQEVPTITDNREQIADARSIYQITSMLEGAVRNGSARRAQVVGKIMAAKTGTTNNERDAWMFAYTPDIVVGTYVGYDEPRTLGHMEGGARVALPIIVDFLQESLKDVPSKPFEMPPGMKIVCIKEMSGSSARPGDWGAIYEVLKDTQSIKGRPTPSEPPAANPTPIHQNEGGLVQLAPYRPGPYVPPRSTPPPSLQLPPTGRPRIY